MNHVLIDTNCWIDLLINESEEKNLLDIEQWVNSNTIAILVPEQLLAEWHRNKNRELNKIREALNLSLKGFRRYTQKNIKQELRRIDRKAQRIEFLLTNGKICKVSKAVHAVVGDRRSKNLAPYHGNPNSDGDAYIFFSTVKFCKSRRISKLIFISHDKQAFSHPGEEKVLHPDLYVEGLAIDYSYGIGPGTDKLRKAFGVSNRKKEENVDYESIFYVFDDNKKISLAEKISKALDAYYDQIPFIPTDILVKMYPFKIADTQIDYTYQSSFQINTNNNALADFFKSIRIDKCDKINFIKPELVKNMKGAKVQIHNLLRRLNHNLIFEIRAISSNIEADIRLNRENDYETLQDRFNNLDFIGVYQELKAKPQNDLRLTIQHAYLYFQFGHFDLSIQLLDSIYESAINKSKTILSFIALYNMKRLKNFINAYYISNDNRTREILKKIDHLSIREHSAIYEGESAFARECIAWIANTDFYHEAFINLTQVVEKIRDHYHLQLNGGYSSNSNYRLLVNNYLVCDQFLEKNCIIFNTYSNYEELTEKLAEGLFMMHTFSKKQTYRVDAIDYFLLQKMIHFAKRETLVKFYHRYYLTGIVKKDLDEERSILKIAEQFFSDYGKLRELLYKDEGKNLFFFWEKYYKVAGNLLLILTISESEADLSGLTKKLLDVLADEFVSNRLEPDHIADFIRQKGKFIKPILLKRFLLLAIDNQKLHCYSVFHAFRSQISRNHNELAIKSKTIFKKIEQAFFQECPKCKTFHEPSILVEIYFLLDGPLKKDLKNKIDQKLSIQFNPDLYYYCAMNEVIDYKLYFDVFLNSCPPLKNNKPRFSIFGDSEANYLKLNQLLNLAYKLNINTSQVLYHRYKGISPYYDWLLDIEGFDYDHFDPEWILAYKTDVYFKQIFASQKVKKFLSQWFKKSRHSTLYELVAKYALDTHK